MYSVVILQSQFGDVLTYRPFNIDLRDASASKNRITNKNNIKIKKIEAREGKRCKTDGTLYTEKTLSCY